MKRISFTLLGFAILFFLGGCTRPLPGTPTPLPTSISIPSPTPLAATDIPTAPATLPILPTPTFSPTPDVPLPTLAPTPSLPGGILPGSPSGPYAVILITPDDSLNIRSGPGVAYPVVGVFSASANTVMRSGPSSWVAGDLWVEVSQPAGGTGWVNGSYLTEYVPPATFCADTRVGTLLGNLGTALGTSNGEALSALVSPVHGMTVHLWRYGIPHTFARSDARWVFTSTFVHNWGAAPASGLDTTGSFQEQVLPKLKEVFNASYSLFCNSLGGVTQYGSQPWPEEYSGINFYTVYKPGTPGVDLDWRYWLVGVEYDQGVPYVFSLIHFNWEP